MRGYRIAVIGSRGIPAMYGGFETFAQELTPRLVERGHDVTVYCRSGYTTERLDAYRGVKLIYTPAVRIRTIEQLSHEFSSIVDSIPRRFDLYYFLGYRGAPFYVPLRLSKRLVIVNTDGLEWKRRKWSALGRAYLKAAERIAVFAGSDALVSDAQAIRQSFLQRFGKDSAYLTNGAYTFTREADLPPDALAEWDLEPDSYYLVACRIEPENNIDLIVEGFIESGSQRTLVIAGGMNYETPYWRRLQALAAGANVRFLGPVYGGSRIEHLHLGAFGYLHGHEVGGTNPALLKAMGCGNLVLALDTPFNTENAADTGRYWSKGDGSLARLIRWADEHVDEARALGMQARDRITTDYSWDSVADAHDAFFRLRAAEHGLRPSARGGET